MNPESIDKLRALAGGPVPAEPVKCLPSFDEFVSPATYARLRDYELATRAHPDRPGYLIVSDPHGFLPDFAVRRAASTEDLEDMVDLALESHERGYRCGYDHDIDDLNDATTRRRDDATES